jgi:hypothetical protein
MRLDIFSASAEYARAFFDYAAFDIDMKIGAAICFFSLLGSERVFRSPYPSIGSMALFTISLTGPDFIATETRIGSHKKQYMTWNTTWNI